MRCGADRGDAQRQRVELRRRALRDAGFTALIAFGLFLPLIGFQTDSQRPTTS